MIKMTKTKYPRLIQKGSCPILELDDSGLCIEGQDGIGAYETAMQFIQHAKIKVELNTLGSWQGGKSKYVPFWIHTKGLKHTDSQLTFIGHKGGKLVGLLYERKIADNVDELIKEKRDLFFLIKQYSSIPFMLMREYPRKKFSVTLTNHWAEELFDSVYINAKTDFDKNKYKTYAEVIGGIESLIAKDLGKTY